MKLFAGGTSDAEFRALAEIRIREARILFNAGEFDGAAYLAGYSVECALKAIIAKAVPAGVLLPPKTSSQLFTHDLALLAKQADLKVEELSSETASSWSVVITWNEQRRYTAGANGDTALSLLDSIDHPQHGILP